MLASSSGGNDGGNNNNNNLNSHANDDQPKKGKGRQKTILQKIENNSNLQVTFSKRRAGVFKKASELSTLCGAHSLVVVFSPGDKPHSFGHPSVEAVSNRFLNPQSYNNETQEPTSVAEQLIAAHSQAATQQRNQQLVSTEEKLSQEKLKNKETDQSKGVYPQAPSVEQFRQPEQLDEMIVSVSSFSDLFNGMSKNNAQNATIFNVNNDEASTLDNIANNLDAGAGSSSWNAAVNNQDITVATSSLWDKINVHDVAGASSWANVNDLSAAAPPAVNPSWDEYGNVAAAGNPSLVQSGNVAAAGNPSWDQFSNVATAGNTSLDNQYENVDAAGNSLSWNQFGNLAAAGSSTWNQLGNTAAADDNAANSWQNNIIGAAQPQGSMFPNSVYDFSGPSTFDPTINSTVPPYNPYPAMMGPAAVNDFNYGLNPTPDYSSMVPFETGQGSNEPAADPNAPPPQNLQDPNARRRRRRHNRR